MNVNLKQLSGNWVLGYALDKHTLKSTPIGYNEFGYTMFDTERSEAGEALFKMKYRNDITQSKILAQAIYDYIFPKFSNVDFVIPMPASKTREIQPVFTLAKDFADLANLPYIGNMLLKKPTTIFSKDLTNKIEKIESLKESLYINHIINQKSSVNVLLIDDLYDTGASLEVACDLLNNYNKINNIYVATVTWR